MENNDALEDGGGRMDDMTWYNLVGIPIPRSFFIFKLFGKIIFGTTRFYI